MHRLVRLPTRAYLTDAFFPSHAASFTNAKILEEQNEENSSAGLEGGANGDEGDIEAGLVEEVKDGEHQRSSSQSTGIGSSSSSSGTAAASS